LWNLELRESSVAGDRLLGLTLRGLLSAVSAASTVASTTTVAEFGGELHEVLLLSLGLGGWLLLWGSSGGSGLLGSGALGLGGLRLLNGDLDAIIIGRRLELGSAW
jgi:hypothetical protein